MKIYQISKDQKDYQGCGKAWVAIQDDTVVAIRYMGNFYPDYVRLEKWILACKQVYYSLDSDNIEIKYIDGTTLGKIKQAAIDAGHPSTGPRGGVIRASDIARKAHEALLKEQFRLFGVYRDKCRLELSKLGEVKSGMCSCFEFIPKE